MGGRGRDPSDVVGGAERPPCGEAGIARLRDQKRDRQHRVAAGRTGPVRLALRGFDLPAIGPADAGRSSATTQHSPKWACFDVRRGLRFLRKKSASGNQWLIIQGRAVGKLFAPLLVLLTRREGLPEQHPQPGPCEALYSPIVLGALALRSLVA